MRFELHSYGEGSGVRLQKENEQINISETSMAFYDWPWGAMLF